MYGLAETLSKINPSTAMRTKVNTEQQALESPHLLLSEMPHGDSGPFSVVNNVKGRAELLPDLGVCQRRVTLDTPIL